MRMHRMILSLAVVMSIACNSLGAAPAQPDLGDEARLVAYGNDRFALRLYHGLREPGNLFFSPYSISTALAMTFAGARGSTREQMEQVLCFPTSKEVMQNLTRMRAPLSPEEFARAFGAIIRDLNARGGQDKYELRVANALWGQQGFQFMAPFTTLVESQYGGHLAHVNFVSAAEQARQTINTWVAQQTNDKIKDLIGPGLLDSTTRLVLTNAVYFKGAWVAPFDPNRTMDEPFTLSDGGTIRVRMMNQKARFGYGETDVLQILEMPYVGQGLSMVVLLPKEVAGIGALEKALTQENLSKWLGSIHSQEIEVALPKFKMTQKFDLKAVLEALGMTNAFSDKANFSGMTGQRDLFISAVVHQAYVDVNEQGTEATAATGVTMGLTALPPAKVPVFRADHPFVFLLRDARSGSLLFLGRMMNPKS